MGWVKKWWVGSKVVGWVTRLVLNFSTINTNQHRNSFLVSRCLIRHTRFLYNRDLTSHSRLDLPTSNPDHRDWSLKCSNAWMHACMDVRMHGCTDAWMHGCMDAWMHVFMDVRMHAYMDAWMHGFKDAWMFGTSDARMHGCTKRKKRNKTKMSVRMEAE